MRERCQLRTTLTFHGLPGSNSGTKSVKLLAAEPGDPQSLLSDNSFTDSGQPDSQRLVTFDHVLQKKNSKSNYLTRVYLTSILDICTYLSLCPSKGFKFGDPEAGVLFVVVPGARLNSLPQFSSSLSIELGNFH